MYDFILQSAISQKFVFWLVLVLTLTFLLGGRGGLGGFGGLDGLCRPRELGGLVVLVLVIVSVSVLLVLIYWRYISLL